MEKLTDNDIIKVLECCEGVDGISYCNGCPLFGDDNCVHIISMEAKGLINRQNEEIDRLLKAIEDKHCVYEKRVVTEAIKEFWEKAKQTIEFRTQPYVYITDGDNLVKEMVGDAE